MHGLSSAYDGLSKMLLLNCVGVINKVDIYAMRLLGCCTQAEKRASRTIGTFGFCLDTKPKAEKPKEPNFSQRSTETRILTERNKRYK
jgi:hypothetical protein